MSQLQNRRSTKVFDPWSNRYETGRISGFFQQMQALLINRMSLGPTARLLDVGCGTGWAVEYATCERDIGYANGIDLSCGMIRQAQERRGQLPNVGFEVADAEALPFDDNSFDAAMCTFSFHHYSSPARALSEVRRVLKPEAKFYVLDNNRRSFWGFYALWDVYFRWTEPGHVRYLTSPELTALFQKAGFQNVQTIYRQSRLFHGKKVFGSAMIVRGVK